MPVRTKIIEATADVATVECPICEKAFAIPRRPPRNFGQPVNQRLCPHCRRCVVLLHEHLTAEADTDPTPPFVDIPVVAIDDGAP
jgi:hypothetical protein